MKTKMVTLLMAAMLCYAGIALAAGEQDAAIKTFQEGPAKVLALGGPAPAAVFVALQSQPDLSEAESAFVWFYITQQLPASQRADAQRVFAAKGQKGCILALATGWDDVKALAGTGVSHGKWRKMFKAHRAGLPPPEQLALTQAEIAGLIAKEDRPSAADTFLAELAIDLEALKLAVGVQ